MINLNTNLSSLITQRSLATSTQRLNQAIEQMTAGFKINHAKDNAANYNITTNMTTKIGAYMVAEDNCAMGLDLLATANGSLDQIADKLQRLRALAVQTSNGTYGEKSKEAINQEANAIVDEIERIYNTTEYNGIKLFDNEPQYELPDTAPRAQYDGFIKEVVKRDTSAMTTLASVDGSVALADGTYSISTPEEMKKLADMTNAGLVSAGDEFVLANDIDLAQYENWTPIGIELRSDTGTIIKRVVFEGKFDGNGYSISNLKIKDQQIYFASLFANVRSSEIKNLALIDVQIDTNKTVGSLVGMAVSSSVTNCYVTGSINCYKSGTGVGGLVADLEIGSIIDSCYSDCDLSGLNTLGGLVGFSGNGTIKNSFSNSRLNQLDQEVIRPTGGLVGYAKVCNIENSGVNSCSETIAGIFVGATYLSSDMSVAVKDCYYSSDCELLGIDYVRDRGGGIVTVENIQQCAPTNVNKTVLQVGSDGGESSQIGVTVNFSISRLIGLQNLGLSDTNEKFITTIDKFLTVLSAKSIEYGATQNRLESALDEISVQYENLVSSRSTLRDADIAEVSSEYIRQQILQQASATLMATANQSPSIALQLI